MKNMYLIKKISLTKKLYLYIFLVIFFCNTALAQSSLPECEGNDNNISKFSIKHFNNHSPICLAGENRDFVSKYMSNFGKSIFRQADVRDIFSPGDFFRKACARRPTI